MDAEETPLAGESVAGQSVAREPVAVALVIGVVAIATLVGGCGGAISPYVSYGRTQLWSGDPGEAMVALDMALGACGASIEGGLRERLGQAPLFNGTGGVPVQVTMAVMSLAVMSLAVMSLAVMSLAVMSLAVMSLAAKTVWLCTPGFLAPWPVQPCNSAAHALPCTGLTDRRTRAP